MPRRNSNSDDDGGGLDSLLDTMTNVVGILVMVLIATQLGVKDAVSRIADSQVVDPAALAEKRDQLQLTNEQRDAILASLNQLEPQADDGVDVQLADLRRQLNQQRTRLQEQEQVANQYAVKIEEDRRRAEEAKKKIEERAAAGERKKALQQQLSGALAEEARIKALLDETPVQQAPPPKVVTLPDPRPAPEGARQVTFLCANNKVYPIAADDVRTAVRKQAEALVKARGLDGGPQRGVDEQQFFNAFRKYNRALHDDFFDIELHARGIYPRLKFTPKSKSGATEKEVLNPRSRFQRLLGLVDNNKYYARFIVLPDSYEVYLTAREVAARKGLLAGWDPQPQSYVYDTWLGGSILFGPQPPPDPNAKPAPPAKPRNVID